MFSFFTIDGLVRSFIERGEPVPEYLLNFVTDPSILGLEPLGPWSSINKRTLWAEAHTLRERVFVRAFGLISGDGKMLSAPGISHTRYEVNLGDTPLSLRELIAACEQHEQLRLDASMLQICGVRIETTMGNDEVREVLQDLADAVSWEASEAFDALYYPRPLNVVPLADEHVQQVMAAMQREVDREARFSGGAAQFANLPWERQAALAERRRLWFACFGITPENWKSGCWNLWKVSDEMVWPPEGYYCAWDASRLQSLF